MENKKTFIGLGILVFALFLGVGYAVVSSVSFNIKGFSNTENYNLNIEITEVKSVYGENQDGIPVEDKFSHELSNKNLTNTFTITDMHSEDTICVNHTISSKEIDIDVKLEEKNGVNISNSNPDYFDVTYKITDGLTDIKNNDKEMSVQVCVLLKKVPIEEEDSTTIIKLTLNAMPIQVN